MTRLTNADVRTALQGSIRKWEKIVAGCRKDRGTLDCPFCHIFYDSKSLNIMCAGCPVSEYSGRPLCRRTPYEHWISVQFSRPSGYAKEPKEVEAAKEMLNFLKEVDNHFFVQGVAVF